MRVLLRADAGTLQGTGHVMRCLTLAEELLAREHEVELMTAPLPRGWLREAVQAAGIPVHRCAPDSLDHAAILTTGADWVVVDSYRIDADAISRLDASVPVLALIDGSDRGIGASLYLDQNLGAEAIERPAAAQCVLSGAPFALVRDAVLAERRPEAWVSSAPPIVLSFMGGTDPTGASVRAAESLAALDLPFRLLVVAPPVQHEALARLLAGRADVQLLAPTPRLPALIGGADIVLSAAGTSAWDVCTIGAPAVLTAVVDNQRASLREAVARGLVLGLDAVDHPDALAGCGELVARLIEDAALREQLSRRCSSTFDGGGKRRVVDAMEARWAACRGEDKR